MLATADPGERLRLLRRHVDEPAPYASEIPAEFDAEQESRIASAFDALFALILAPEMSILARQPATLAGLRMIEASAQRNRGSAAAFPRSLSERWDEAVVERRKAILAAIVTARRPDLEGLSGSPPDAPEIVGWLRDFQSDLGAYTSTQPYMDALTRFKEIRGAQLLAGINRFKNDLEDAEEDAR